MPRTRPIALRLFLFLLPAILTSFIPARAAEPPWLEIHSAHFTVITDAGDKKGREVAFRFEQMRAVFASLIAKDRLNQPVPLTILALKNDKSYYQLAPLRHGQPIDVPGFFLHGDDQDFIVLNLFEVEPWRAVAHDFAQMLLNYNYPPAQGWFDEGLAEYFSSIRMDNRQIAIGGDPELQSSYSEDLIGNQRETHPSKSLTELLGVQVWLPIPDLFTTRHDTSSYTEATHHTLYYAESWMVMHYLLHEKKLGDTGNYFALALNQHLPVEEAIQKAYGMSPAQFEQAVKDYFHSLASLSTALDAARAKVPDGGHPNDPSTAQQAYVFPSLIQPDDSVITAKALSESDARALYAEIALRIPERRELGLKDLQKLATTATLTDQKAEAKAERTERRNDADKRTGNDSDPKQLPTNAIGNPLAHRILAWDHIQHNEFDDALSELRDAAALNPSDMWVRYYLCVLKYRSAQARHTDTPGLPNMMIDLKSVLDWYPELASAYDLLALARTEGGSPTPALQSERIAISLSPRDDRFVYHLGQIFIAAKKPDSAQALLDRLKAGPNPQLAVLLRDQITQAGSERRYGIPLSSASGGDPNLAPQKTPFDVLDEDAAKRTQAEDAARAAGPEDKRPTKFLKGRLLDIDCSQAPAAILSVSAGGPVRKFRAADFKSLLLIGADEFSCEWRNRQVTVNYKAGGLVDGDLISLEVR